MNKKNNNFPRRYNIPITICLASGIIIGAIIRYCRYQPYTDTTKNSTPPLSLQQPFNATQTETTTASADSPSDTLLAIDHPQKSTPEQETTPLLESTSRSALTTAQHPVSTPLATTTTLKLKPTPSEMDSTQSPAAPSSSPLPSQPTSKPQQTSYEPLVSSKAQHSTETVNTQTRTIVVKNAITKKMLGYSHWTGTYRPTTFEISINNTPLAQDQERPVDIKNNRLIISYRYSFMKGYRTGARNITFNVDPEATTVDLTFAWKNKWHILCDHASPESAEEIEFEE